MKPTPFYKSGGLVNGLNRRNNEELKFDFLFQNSLNKKIDNMIFSIYIDTNDQTKGSVMFGGYDLNGAIN